MKKSVVKVAALAVLGAFAGGVYAEPITDVQVSNVSQSQSNTNLYQLMDVGSVVGPVSSNGKSRVRALTPFSTIQQSQTGAGSIQEMFVGTVFANGSGANPESNVTVNNLRQTQTATSSFQRMEIGTVGVAGLFGLPGASMNAGKSNVVVTGTVLQAQGGANNVQFMRVGTVRPN